MFLFHMDTSLSLPLFLPVKKISSGKDRKKIQIEKKRGEMAITISKIFGRHLEGIERGTGS